MNEQRRSNTAIKIYPHGLSWIPAIFRTDRHGNRSTQTKANSVFAL